MNNSVVIIGGGLGGLFTGAILAKEGLEVTILEKNKIIGGGLQSFARFGELFDTGMHVIGGMHKDGNIRRICEYLGIWSKVHIRNTDPEGIDKIFFSEDGRTYNIAKGRTAFVESLAKDFPHQKGNLKAYVDALYRLAGEVDLFYLRRSPEYMQVHSEEFQMSASGLINRYISDEHLRSVVAYLNPLYGGRKNVTPAYIHALISVLYIDGSSKFAGGSLLFAEVLRDFIQEHGGRVLAGDPVKTVHSDGKSVSAVTTASGARYNADYYVCAIHPCSFFELLEDPRLLPKPYRERLSNLPNSYSAFTLNIKLKPGTFKFFNYTMYYISRYDSMWKFGESEQWPCGFLYTTPPEIEQGEYASKVIVTAPMQWEEVRQWENTTVGNRGAEYEKWKMDCADKLLDCMEEICHGFRNCIEEMNSATPLTIRDFYGVKEGSMYGFSKDCNNILLSQVPVVTKVHNLLLTGQNCNLHGFCGVALTAINTSEAILGRNYVLDQIDRFDDMRPHYEHEIYSAMQRLSVSPQLAQVARFLYPERDICELRRQVADICSSEEFQKKIMASAVETIISKTCDTFIYEGLENVSRTRASLFVSNHRDIVLDAAILGQVILAEGMDTPEITFGANLMRGDFIIDIGKSNKMFKVERPGKDMREFLRASAHLSDYIRHCLLGKGQSVWIAQRNGRTKDGIDRTDQAIIKMFNMSGDDDNVMSISQLNIVPVAISYEWEPCDLLKAIELSKRAVGPYEKTEGEDLNSILTGITQQKGRVHLSFCKPLTEEDLLPLSSLPNNAFYKAVASIIDERVCRAYKLYPNNYIAYDILSGGAYYAKQYTIEQKNKFEKHINDVTGELTENNKQEIKEILLGIYANPVSSKNNYFQR